MYNVRVNSVVLEITPKARVVLNLLALDFSDVTKRGVTASNAFIVKLTDINMEALEFPSPINSTSKAYTNIFKADILLGKNVISTGSVSIKKTDLVKNEVSLQYVDSSRDFYNDLDRQAEDIDLSEFDLKYEANTFDNIIPNIIPGQIWVSKKYQGAINGTEDNIIGTFNEFAFRRPLYSVKELLRKFIKGAGFDVDFSNIEESTEIDRLLLTSNAENFIVSDFRQTYLNTIFKDEILNIDIADNDFTLVSSLTLFDEITNTTFPYSLNLRGTINVIGGPATITVTDTDFPQDPKLEILSLDEGLQFINFTTPQYETTSATGIDIKGEIQFQDVKLYLTLNEKDIADVVQSWDPGGLESVLTDYHFLGAHNLPDITQLDMLRILWSLYFIKPDIDVFQKKITLKLFAKESELSAIDITDKIVDEGSILPANIFARQNIFSYSNDSDTFSDFSQFNFRSAAPIDKPIKEYITFPFASSKNKVYDGVGNVARVEVYNRTVTFGDVDSRIELTPRLLLVSEADPSNAVFEKLNWSFLFAKYYQGVFSRITGKRHPVNMHMTFEEFQDISDKGFVFIRNKGLFFVENITKFELGTPTALSLLHLN